MALQSTALGAKRKIEFTNRQLVHLILPLIFEQLLTITVGLADSLMVSTVGDAAISAVSLVDSISNLMIYIFTAMASGGAVVAGQYIGRREESAARRSAQQLVVLLAAVSLVITALLYLFKGFVLTRLFGEIEPDVMAATDTYYSYVMASIPAIALYNGGAALMRTMEKSDVTLKVSLLMNFINVAGNAILIFGFHFDVAGVAIPTLVSRVVAAVVILALLRNESLLLHLESLRGFRVDRRIMRNILYISIPSGIENGMFHFGRLILVSLVATFGTASIVANAIGNTMGNFHIFAGNAVSIGLVTVISRCVGARDFDSARYYMKKLMAVAYALMFVVNIMCILTIPVVLRIYNVDAETAELARIVMLLHGVNSIVFWAPSFVIPQFLRAAGDARFNMYASMGTMWFVRVLMAYVIGGMLGYGVVGVWFAHSVLDWVVRSILFFARYRSNKWEQKAIEKEKAGSGVPLPVLDFTFQL